MEAFSVTSTAVALTGHPVTYRSIRVSRRAVAASARLTVVALQQWIAIVTLYASNHKNERSYMYFYCLQFTLFNIAISLLIRQN